MVSTRGLRHGGLVDAGEGRQQRDQHDDDRDADGRPAPLDAGGDLGARDVVLLRSLQRPARQEDEESRRRTTSRRRRRWRCRRARARRAGPARRLRWTRLVGGGWAVGGSELIIGPSVQRGGAQLVGLAARHRRAAIAPGGADVGDDGGDLVVGEECRRTAACRRASDCPRCPADSRHSAPCGSALTADAISIDWLLASGGQCGGLPSPCVP